MDSLRSDAIILSLASPEELFSASPQPDRLTAAGPRSWDDNGAVLGEPATARLLRQAFERTRADRLIIRLRPDDLNSENGGAVLNRLRAWCECKLAANAADIRAIRWFGLRALAIALFALALMLGASVVLQSETLLSPPGPLRLLFSEALVIAGWVVMWRPVEMLLFDPARAKLENRMIRRAMAMRWSTEAHSHNAGVRRGDA